MREYHNSIIGEMAPDELKWLHLNAGEMNSIVEIGSLMGRSTHALLVGCSGTVHAVDTFERVGTRNAFNNNVGRFKNLKVYEMDSIKASELFEDNSIDMIFIDADHSYKAVKADIEAWLPKAKKLICGHDYEPNEWPGVVKAVDEKFNTIERATNIWFYKLT